MININIFRNQIKRKIKYLNILEALGENDGLLINLGYGVVTKNGIRRFLLGSDGLYLGNEDHTLDKIATTKELLEISDDKG